VIYGRIEKPTTKLLKHESERWARFVRSRGAPWLGLIPKNQETPSERETRVLMTYPQTNNRAAPRENKQARGSSSETLLHLVGAGFERAQHGARFAHPRWSSCLSIHPPSHQLHSLTLGPNTDDQSRPTFAAVRLHPFNVGRGAFVSGARG